MELTDGIKHIIDGNAIIIMGAGASAGAQNVFGDFPSGSSLAYNLYAKCGIASPDDKNDLQDAAQCYEDKFSASNLISEIRSQLTCTSFTKSHEVIFSLPWMRYYTTNYDEVALLAARKCGVIINPVTITSSLKNYSNTQNLCVYINGYIGKLNEHTIHHEFKLTANSYLSQESIINSQWGDYLFNDLETAKCIFIFGLSLKYDLDLSRLIYNTTIKEKTIIIDRENLSDNSENRLGRFGKVYKVGADGFSTAIREVQKSYKPLKRSPIDKLYTAFNYAYHRQYKFENHFPDNVFRLYLNGTYVDSLFCEQKGSYSGFIKRSILKEAFNCVCQGKRFVFLHSDMGNGKTACINELCYRLSSEDIHVFTLKNADCQKLREEISDICLLSNEQRVVVIIDDYTSYMEVIRLFALQDNGHLQFVLAARSALNLNKMPSILASFDVQENSSAVFDLNKLNKEDIANCIHIFDQYGLWGKRARLTVADKTSYLLSHKGGNGCFQSIMLDVIQSDLMQKKISELITSIKKGKENYPVALTLILLAMSMNLRIAKVDIDHIVGINVSIDAVFNSDPAIKELINVGDGNNFVIKSPVTAQFVLQKASEPEDIIRSLLLLASYAQRYSETSKYNNILISIISYSHINSFLRGFENPEQFLMQYYDELSQIDYYKANNFFWLQYAIACIEMKKFKRAQQYLNTAYGLIPEGFEPFQINNQQARLYLEMIITEESNNIYDDFEAAHKLLMLPITSLKDNEYNIIRLFGYYCRKQFLFVMKKSNHMGELKSACKEAYARVDNFSHNHPLYAADLKDLRTRLLCVCVQQ